MRHPITRLLSAFLLLLFGAPTLSAQRAAAPHGRSITGLPALNFDADEGMGYGALLQLYDYGSEGAQPYRYTVQPIVFLTTRGRRDVSLFVDAPHLLPRGWRLTGAIASERQLATPYYGVGNETVADDAATAGANPYYYRYGRDVVRMNADVQRELGLAELRLLVGIGSRRVAVTPVPYGEGTTLLAQQVGPAPLPAFTTRYVRAGLVVDTRDREIGTRRGVWADVLVQSTRLDTNGFTGGLPRPDVFVRATATLRRYTPLGPTVTLAQRLVVQNVFSDIPPTELSLVQGSYTDGEALGGASSLRGIPRNRYVGRGIAFGNLEARWDASTFSLRDTPSRLVLSAFVDAGRVWASGINPRQLFQDLHAGYGAGARLAVGPTFVVAADVGHSSQSMAAVYVGLGYLF
jgi:outer membrane protein assembly factor BamA